MHSNGSWVVHRTCGRGRPAGIDGQRTVSADCPNWPTSLFSGWSAPLLREFDCAKPGRSPSRKRVHQIECDFSHPVNSRRLPIGECTVRPGRRAGPGTENVSCQLARKALRGHHRKPQLAALFAARNNSVSPRTGKDQFPPRPGQTRSSNPAPPGRALPGYRKIGYRPHPPGPRSRRPGPSNVAP